MSTGAIIAGIAAAATVAGTAYTVYQGMHPPKPLLDRITKAAEANHPDRMKAPRLCSFVYSLINIAAASRSRSM